MSRITKANKEYGVEFSHYECDGNNCLITIDKEDPENYGWFSHFGEDFCEDCTKEYFKKCICCKKIKPKSDFYGHNSVCWDCVESL